MVASFAIVSLIVLVLTMQTSRAFDQHALASAEVQAAAHPASNVHCPNSGRALGIFHDARVGALPHFGELGIGHYQRSNVYIA